MKKHSATSNSVQSLAGAALLALGLGVAVLAAQATHAQTCPFDDGNSSLAVEGVVLTRYALGITGAPLVANTGINSVDSPTVEAAINCPSCGLNITGNPTMTVADATIISRKLAGFSGNELTNGVALGSGTRNTPTAVQSFLLAGCGATGGTVTSVTAGTGLAGGPITTTGALSIANSYKLPQSCGNGQVPKSDGAGNWACAADLTGTSGGSGTVTSIATGAGLTGGPITGAGTIGLAASQLLPVPACADSQTVIWSSTSSNWICAGWQPPGTGANTFVNGGNAFGVPAVLGTTDTQELRLYSGGDLKIEASQRLLVSSSGSYSISVRDPSSANFSGGTFIEAKGPTASNLSGPNITSGSRSNFNEAPYGATISGGGYGGSNCFNVLTGTATKSCSNRLGLNASASTIAGGYGNDVIGFSGGVISGGINNSIGSGNSGVIAGGERNFVNAPFATVAGGASNTAGSSITGAGIYSFVAGGVGNYTQGEASFAAGNYAKAFHDNAFVWGGSSVETNSAGPGTFTAYAPGGFYFFRGIVGAGGCVLPAGVVSWSCTSDRATKSNIQALNPLDTLRRVVAMPVARWNYIGTEKIKNVGPMAQDFFKAFSLGDSDKSIASMNMSGVALSAIQGLNQVIKEKDAKIEALTTRLKAIEKKLGM